MLKSIIAVVFLFLLFNSKVAAQQETIEVPASLLLTAVEKAGTYVMFNVKDNRLHILDQDTKALRLGNEEAPEYGDYTVFTVEQVKNYLQQRRTEKIKFTKDFSGLVTIGDGHGGVLIMDLTPTCPPHCSKG